MGRVSRGGTHRGIGLRPLRCSRASLAKPGPWSVAPRTATAPPRSDQRTSSRSESHPMNGSSCMDMPTSTDRRSDGRWMGAPCRVLQLQLCSQIQKGCCKTCGVQLTGLSTKQPGRHRGWRAILHRSRVRDESDRSQQLYNIPFHTITGTVTLSTAAVQYVCGDVTCLEVLRGLVEVRRGASPWRGELQLYGRTVVPVPVPVPVPCRTAVCR